jgi:arginyl-tRNA--protein-N-Asp/Glu arginylyltransferase
MSSGKRPALESLVRVEECVNGPCPYLDNGIAWETRRFTTPSFDPELYETMLAQGWRRSGTAFYRNACSGCGLCLPIRISRSNFAPSASQKRVLAKNADLSVGMRKLSLDPESYLMYARYSDARHGKEGNDVLSYIGFLLDSPLDSRMISYRSPDSGRLLGEGYVDVLPNGLSSVYFAFEPSEGRRSLGTYSVMRELKFAESMGKEYYYLGFWVPGSVKMGYKANFSPFELALDGKWTGFSDRNEAEHFLELT